MLLDENDTIAAISTGLTESGIGIVRVSGPQAIEITDRIFYTKNGRHILLSVPTHTIHYGFIRDGEDVLDEVMVSVMRAPRSFTKEDTAEINCHGGVYAMKRVLEKVIGEGARAALPGEFTKRAFLNGRIDLTQAEAVMSLIESTNDYALKSSAGLLSGTLRNVIEQLRSEILYENASIEAALDDPEHYSLEGYAQSLQEKNELWISRIRGLLETFDNGRMIQEGIVTAIVGRPNAGKSSLMNALLGQERAIVTDVPGTTRDVITEKMSLNGLTLIIRDTAGIHHTLDKVESIGIDRALESAREADLVICVMDSSQEADENDFEILRMIRNKKAIILLNKNDLPSVTDHTQIRRILRDLYGKDIPVPILSVSAKEGKGLDQLSDAIRNMFFEGGLSFNNQIVISNVRQKENLSRAMESLISLSETIASGLPEDFYSIDLAAAYEYLGDIIGENASEDLVNEIFSKFCMGK